jgi:hypothetical protein
VAVLLIAFLDVRSTSDLVHARIPYIFLAYIAAGIAWYAIRRKTTATA